MEHSEFDVANNSNILSQSIDVKKSIPFNKPFITGREIQCIQGAIDNNRLSGGGPYTDKVHRFLESKFNFSKVLLTTSCTDAIEMATYLLDVKEGDEIIIPSYTFVSTANPFVMRGATIKFADSENDNPNISFQEIVRLTTEKTKVIVLVHYAAVAPKDLDEIIAFAKEHNIFILEDAAQCINAKTRDGRFLGSLGDLGTLSFHDTKNIQCGEGGCIIINNQSLIERAGILWEKGTNRKAFIDKKVKKYEWVDIGSSYLMSELNAAFLWSQLQDCEQVNIRRRSIWADYHQKLCNLSEQGYFVIPNKKAHENDNGHIFYLVMRSQQERNELINHLKEKKISAVFHYQSLHCSKYFNNKYIGPDLINTKRYSDCLLRLPLFYELEKQDYICEVIQNYYQSL